MKSPVYQGDDGKWYYSINESTFAGPFFTELAAVQDYKRYFLSQGPCDTCQED